MRLSRILLHLHLHCPIFHDHHPLATFVKPKVQILRAEQILSRIRFCVFYVKPGKVILEPKRFCTILPGILYRIIL